MEMNDKIQDEKKSNPKLPREYEISFDDMLPYVGEFGKFQKLLYAMFYLASIPMAFHTLIMYFAAQKPGWRCAKNSSICTSNETFSAENSGRCDMPRSDWEFDQPLGYSIVTQFDIYCSSEWKIHMTSSVLFLGWSVGALFLGWLTDNFGRKRVLFPSMTIVMLLGGVASFSPNIYLLFACRLLIGVFIPGTGTQMFVMITELAGSRHRSNLAIAYWTYAAVAQLLLCFKAYFLQQWKAIYIVCTWPYLLTLVMGFFVPESARWLLAKGKKKEAMVILHRIARWNKKAIPSEISLNVDGGEDAERKSHISDLFKTREMALATLDLGFAWFVVSMVYYGISLAAGDFGGSIYTNFVLSQLTHFPGCLIAMYLCNRTRKKTVIFLMLFSGITCGLVAAVPATGRLKFYRVFLGTLGKLCITASYDSLYLWSSELFPTRIRGIGMGFFQVNARLGGAASPWIAKALRSLHPAAPFITMGGFAVSAALLLFYQAETKGKGEEVQYEDDKRGNSRVIAEEECSALEKVCS